MEKEFYVIDKNGVYTREEEHRYLVDSTKEDATKFNEKNATSVALYLGDGAKKIPVE